MSIDDTTVDAVVVAGTPGAKPVDDFRPDAAGWAARVGVALLIAWVVLCVPANIASPFTIAGGEANAFSEAVIFAIIGLSLNVLIGYSGQISLGHNAFVGIGAFTSAYVVTEIGQDFYLGVLIAAVVGGLQALLLGLVSLRVTGLYFALVTLTYGEMARLSLFNIESLTGGTAGQLAPRPLGFESDYRYYYLCLAGLAIVLFIDWRMMQSKSGRALLALRENPKVAQTWGINTQTFTIFAFAISGTFAGFGGALLAHRDTAVVSNPFDFQLALTFIAMTVVGGLRNRAGVVMGSLFYAFLRNGELIELLDAITPGDLEAILRDSSLPLLGQVSLTTEVAPLVFGPIILLIVVTRFPGGFGQVTLPIQRWLGGRRFQFAEVEDEITVNDVRA